MNLSTNRHKVLKELSQAEVKEIFSELLEEYGDEDTAWDMFFDADSNEILFNSQFFCENEEEWGGVVI